MPLQNRMNLAGANMDSDLTSSDQITWHQDKFMLWLFCCFFLLGTNRKRHFIELKFKLIWHLNI